LQAASNKLLTELKEYYESRSKNANEEAHIREALLEQKEQQEKNRQLHEELKKGAELKSKLKEIETVAANKKQVTLNARESLIN
jgi:alpha-D-ribose 1-methylphosphonate 5-triphosphate synthase subunit PhnG